MIKLKFFLYLQLYLHPLVVLQILNVRLIQPVSTDSASTLAIVGLTQNVQCETTTRCASVNPVTQETLKLAVNRVRVIFSIFVFNSQLKTMSSKSSKTRPLSRACLYKVGRK